MINMTAVTYYLCLILVLTMERSLTVGGSRLQIEAEDMDSVTSTMIRYRSNASNNKSVIMTNGQVISFDLCLMAATNMSVESLTYSNDGWMDRIEVAMDNAGVWTLDSKANSNGGNGWNQFVTAVSDNSSFLVKEGRHMLTIRILSADQYGVEIDFIDIQTYSIQSLDTLKCSIFCFDDITYVDDTTYKTSTAKKATAVQRSVKTKCAEEDNVNIPVFHESASKFVISASFPKYTTFLNNRGADWLNCEMNQAYWKFSNVLLEQKSVTIQNGEAVMNISFTKGFIFDENNSTLEVEFELMGSSSGSTDSDIGAWVHLKGIQSSENIKIDFQYYGRSKDWSKIQTFIYNGSESYVIFKTPDFSFFEGKGNKIRLTFLTYGQSSSSIMIQELFMFKRNIKPDQSTTIYKDATTIIEGVDIDMWWRINESMSVSLKSSSKSFNNVDFIRIYQQVPWLHASLSQVFVLYQDGNVRLLPLTPHGLDWVPFGSSVLIGQSDPTSFRPSAPIAHLDIDPDTLTVKIFYYNGGHTTLQIKTTLHETELYIHESTYTRSLSLYPFFTFRSMWISDGNADVDHVTVDGRETQRILDNWGTLSGHFFAFYRKCISKHNTLSPDIKLKVLT